MHEMKSPQIEFSPSSEPAALADFCAPSLQHSGFQINHYTGLYLPGLPLKPRDVLVYLPPGYDPSGATRYPVIYMQDGQNLFESRSDLAPTELKCSWAVDRIATGLIQTGQMRPAIIVGIFNTEDRNSEYSPCFDNSQNCGGEVATYTRFLVEGLKPFIDRRYQTDPSQQSTAIAGSSLGALASLHAGLSHPEVFGKVVAMSPAAWWGGRKIVEQVSVLGSPPAIWLDVGTLEGGEDTALSGRTVDHTRALHQKLESSGWNTAERLHYLEDRDARHEEQFWQARLYACLSWLFPAAQVKG
jgi:predicted alpha/beta superfamily hydrolase